MVAEDALAQTHGNEQLSVLEPMGVSNPNGEHFPAKGSRRKVQRQVPLFFGDRKMSMFCSGHELLTVRDAIRWIESQTTVKPSVETIHRWMRKGVRGRMLPSRQIGGVWYVPRDDLAAFIEAGDKRATKCPAKASGPIPDPEAIRCDSEKREA